MFLTNILPFLDKTRHILLIFIDTKRLKTPKGVFNSQNKTRIHTHTHDCASSLNSHFG